MSQLFKPDAVYPSDHIGPFIELTGPIIIVEEILDYWKITIQTDKGIFTGYTDEGIILHRKFPPRIGYKAKIHIYNSGGGWYPDDRIVGWGVFGNEC